MRWLLLPAGKPSLPFIRDGCADYLRRLSRYTQVELRPLRNVGPATIQRVRGDCEPGAVHLVLDEKGELLTTREFASLVDRWRNDARGCIACWIGGADGHPPEIRQGATLVLALGRMTLQHELALLMFLEQLYRVHTLLRGEPYHRD